MPGEGGIFPASRTDRWSASADGDGCSEGRSHVTDDFGWHRLLPVRFTDGVTSQFDTRNVLHSIASIYESTGVASATSATGTASALVDRSDRLGQTTTCGYN